MCKSRLVSEVTEGEGHGQYYQVPINSTSHDDDDCTLTLNIGSRPVYFLLKIYTVTECSVMSKTVFKTLKPKRVLWKARKVLNGPGGG